MKRLFITLFITIAAWQSANAMSYERAREEALYLTDKMAYELNLNDQQYNDAYEINLDYFLSLNSERDLYEDYLSYRLSDFRHILYDWQYSLMMAADYFIRPVYWRSGGWYFSIYNYYNHGYFYYSYPAVYYHYRGGHGHSYYHHGFYADRRPAWNGGLRGNRPMGGRPQREGRGPATHERNGRVNGSGYHFDVPRGNRERTDRGNSFGNSSSRNSSGDYQRRRDDNNVSGRDRGYGTGRGNTETRRPESYGTDRPSSSSSRSSGMSRSNSTPRSSSMSGSYGGSRGSGTSGSYGGSRSSSMSGSYGGSRSSGMSGGFGGSRGSSMSNGHGGSRGGGGGSSSRGRR